VARQLNDAVHPPVAHRGKHPLPRPPETSHTRRYPRASPQPR
jgi:hypothetical protein